MVQTCPSIPPETLSPLVISLVSVEQIKNLMQALIGWKLSMRFLKRSQHITTVSLRRLKQVRCGHVHSFYEKPGLDHFSASSLGNFWSVCIMCAGVGLKIPVSVNWDTVLLQGLGFTTSKTLKWCEWCVYEAHIFKLLLTITFPAICKVAAKELMCNLKFRLD